MLNSAPKPMQGQGSVQLTVPFIKRLNKTESAAFSNMPFWTFFMDSYFLYFAIDILLIL
jgi:hypothetical protein